MTRVLLALLLSAGQAAALSCVPPDPLESFRRAAVAPESYVVLHGRLEVDGGAFAGLTPPMGEGQATLPAVEGRFQGHALGLAGFTQPVSGPIHLAPACFGSFCGSIGPGTFLLFAQPSGTGHYVVTVDPCGAWAFEGVTQATLDALAGCLRGEGCGG